ncbi:MAG: hypothetical protein M1829_000303 [Trizodia sp. TS-e1964]|nr:MAG: hypothetical protein M1829_000303 [Trizodia sp. TS-e1964]
MSVMDRPLPKPPTSEYKRRNSRMVHKTSRQSLKPSKTASYPLPGLSSMRFIASVSKQRTVESMSDKKMRRKVNQSLKLKAISLRPAPHSTSLSSSLVNSPFSAGRSLVDLSTSSLPSTIPSRTPAHSTPPHPGTPVRMPIMASVGPTKNGSEGHADYSGLAKDGSIHWTHDRAPSPPPKLNEKPLPTPIVDDEIFEVPLIISNKVPRPRIQLTIPEVRPTSTNTSGTHRAAHKPTKSTDSQMHQREEASPPPPSTVSPMTTESTQKRRFSALGAPPVLSLEGIGLEQPFIASEWLLSPVSGSSDEAAGESDASCYSNRSSFSSVGTDPASKTKLKVSRPLSASGSVAFSIVTPVQAGVFDEKLPLRESNNMTKNKLSIVDYTHRNKPLPLEPLELQPAPLTIAGRPCSRSSTRLIKSSRPNTPMGQSMALGIPKRTPSQFSFSSEYSTLDLDAIDTAFLRSSPPRNGPSLLEAEEALELQLSTITEDAPFEWDPIAATKESRPSPTSPAKNQRPSMHRRNGSKATLQLRTNFEQRHRALSSSNSISRRGEKASKLLGLISDTPPATSPETSSSDDYLIYKSSFSHRSLPTSPSVSNGDSSPPSDYSISPDPAVQEVHARLELLRAKTEQGQYKYEESISMVADFSLPIQIPSPETLRTPRPASRVVAEVEVVAEVKAERRGRFSGDNIPSMVSFAASEVPEWYINMPSSALYEDDAWAKEEAERKISAEAAEMVLLKILESLDNLQDLFSTAVVSRGFYRTYKRNELPLMKKALKSMSPAAWELREMTPPFLDGNELDCDRPVPEYTPSTYLRFYTRDLYTMVALKSLILVRCQSFLRAETISALAGADDKRSYQLDNAFWRVWTFCKIFGSSKGREDDIVGQMDWLRGGVLANQAECSSSIANTDASLGINSVLLNPPEHFAGGNHGGLSSGELWDMMEIWTCLGVLIRGFQGKPELARDHGVFRGQDVEEGNLDKEHIVLEEWACYLLTLGPQVILDLATPSEQSALEGFTIAAKNGWTVWEAPAAGGSRGTFLKEAVTRIYEERVAGSRGHSPSNSISSTTSSSSKASASSKTSTAPSIKSKCEGGERERERPTSSDRQRLQGHRLEIQRRRASPEYKELPPSEERPMSHWQTALSKFSHTSGKDIPAVPAVPTVSAVEFKPLVDDPVDKAVFRLVGMGFTVEESKKALARTDTGENLDVEAAVAMLLKMKSEPSRAVSSAGFY